MAAPHPRPRVLVHTRTTDYRHASIPDGVEAVRSLGAAHGFTVDATEDPAVFEAPLGAYAAVVFLSTSGDVLTPAGRERLARYVDGGGGFVGVHAAACTEYGWPRYGELLGARFARHPALQPGRVLVEDREHPATRHLPAVWEFTDEWYDFRTNPRAAVRVLASADEGSYDGGGMGDDHPLVWCRDEGAGRVFYTALGHAPEAFRDPDYRRHLLGGIGWAARLTTDDGTPPDLRPDGHATRPGGPSGRPGPAPPPP
ncbi:ThuA domain-containing protein [Streptomyces fructofermentans]|uniref:ThuA domain-containing protein n=1 Tax=Streptomyces fructofermentans TaxID=152141 RepID=UPI0033FCE2BE